MQRHEDQTIVNPAVLAREPTHAAGQLLHLERLQAVCRLVSSTLDLGQVLPFICSAVQDSLGCDRVTLYSIDARAHRLLGPLAIRDETDRAPPQRVADEAGTRAAGGRGEGPAVAPALPGPVSSPE